MWISFLPVRLHGWLDEVATLSYLLTAALLGFHGAALVLVLFGAAVHLLNTRLTDYPQGTFKMYSLRVHARIELAEGLAMLAGAVAFSGWLGLAPVASANDSLQTSALISFGVAQVSAALFSELEAPARQT